MNLTRVTLITLASLAFGFSIVSLYAYTVRAEQERAAYFLEQEEAKSRGLGVFSGPYCSPDRHPTFLVAFTLLAATTFVISCLAGNSLWATPFSIAALLMFVHWYFDTQTAIEWAEMVSVSGIDLYLDRASIFDIFVLSAFSLFNLAQLVFMCFGSSLATRSRSLP